MSARKRCCTLLTCCPALQSVYRKKLILFIRPQSIFLLSHSTRPYLRLAACYHRESPFI